VSDEEVDEQIAGPAYHEWVHWVIARGREIAYDDFWSGSAVTVYWVAHDSRRSFHELLGVDEVLVKIDPGSSANAAMC
jgi:hypothetical protein